MRVTLQLVIPPVSPLLIPVPARNLRLFNGLHVFLIATTYLK
jgi:hypothetical protein